MSKDSSPEADHQEGDDLGELNLITRTFKGQNFLRWVSRRGSRRRSWRRSKHQEASCGCWLRGNCEECVRRKKKLYQQPASSQQDPKTQMRIAALPHNIDFDLVRFEAAEPAGPCYARISDLQKM